MKCFGSPSKPHRCKIVLLDETELIQEIQSSHRGQDILEIVFKHLGLLETVYFGLRYVNPKGYTCWLDATDKVVKQMKGIEVPITFYFGVRFYASDPCKLLEETTRYQFFLQLKQDIQLSRLTVTNELAAQLLAFIIQSELGDFDPRVHHQGTTATGAGSSYIAEFRLIGGPVAQSADWEHKVCDLHKQLIGQIPAAVEMQFLERLKWLDLYGCELHPVIAEDANEYFIGLSPHGIIVLKNKLKVANYFWPRIVKIMRKSKYFMIRVIDKESEENTYGFEMASKEASKAIHRSCKEHQEFFKLSQSTAASNGTARRGGTLNKNGSTAKNGGSIVNGGGGASTANSQRPAPMLVRVPSRRYQRMGLPDGSENTSGHMSLMKREVTGGGGGFENSAFNNSGMSRHNSTPSLMKSGGHFNGSQTRYTTSPYHVTCYDTSMMGTKHERGLFSKSASASPLSVRSAFVSRYDYGSGSTPYISHMKRNTSSLSLQRNGGGPPQQQQNITSNGYRNPHHHHHHHHHRRSHLSDNESEVSKCSRASRHSSRSRTTSKSQCRHDTSAAADSGTESDSSRKRRHRHRKHRHQLAEQPQLVAWNDVALVEKKGGGGLPRPEISSNGYSHPMAKHAATAASAVVRNLTTYNYGVGGGGGDEMMGNGRIGGGQSRSLVNGSTSSSHPRNTHSSSASNGGFLSSEMKKYITHDPVDSAHLSELEKRDIKYTNVESDSKFYKVRPSTNGGSSHRLPPLLLLSAEKSAVSPPSQTLVDSYAYGNGNGNGSNSSNQVPPTRYRFDYHHDKQQQQQQQPLSPMNIAPDLSYEGASAVVSKAAERPLPYYGVDGRGGHNNNYSAYDGGGGGGNGYLDYLGKSQSLAQVSSMNGGFHQQQQQQQNQQNQPTPRVHFQTPHSTTAYFSNHDVFMSAMGATPNNGSNGIHHKDGSAQILPMPLAATRKTHEMSTEL